MPRTAAQIVEAQLGAQSVAYAQLLSQAETVAEELAVVKETLRIAAPARFRKLYPHLKPRPAA